MNSYDMILAGAGAAGLLLADALGSDPHFRDMRILLLDKATQKANDRTWCFWEQGTGAFDGLLHASWKKLRFGGKDFGDQFPIAPYTYKMLRGIDFYRAYHERIGTYANLQVQQATVEHIREESHGVEVVTDQGTYSAPLVFSSLFSWEALVAQQRFPVLQQHFLGWFVRTETPVFDPSAATFMDFSIPQLGNTRFMYVLPFSETEALVEYTLFSGTQLKKETYEQALEAYMRDRLKCTSYEILETEQGRIPMSCYDFASGNSGRLLHIGMAGGWAKPSTGYTFKNTHKKVQALVAHLKSGKPLTSFGKKTRYWWYDLLLLDILDRDNARGRHIFEALFRRRKAPLILKFLDEETSLWEDLQVIWACPKKDFVQALLRRLF